MRDRFLKKRGLPLSILILCGALAVLSPTSAWARFYRYTDEEGVLHVTDDITKIPEKYRDEAADPKAEQSGGVEQKTVPTRQDNAVKKNFVGWPEDEISIKYAKGDFRSAAKLLEGRISALEGQAGTAADGPDKALMTRTQLNHDRLSLAYIYAWKLGRPDAALSVLRKIDEIRRSSTEAREYMPRQVDLILAGEIYEMKGDHAKAVESYRKSLEAFAATSAGNGDELWDVLGTEIMNLIKYQIDGVNLKSGNGIKPELSRLKLSRLSKETAAKTAPLLSMIYNPVYVYEMYSLMSNGAGPVGGRADGGALVKIIKNSPPNLSFMVTDYALIMMYSGGSVTRYSEEALEDYLSKYPEGYYALYLRRFFYRYYRDKGENAKAQRLLSELKTIEAKRKIDLGLEPDKRFSSPVETFKTFKNAFLAGDADTVQDCFIPDGRMDLRGDLRAIKMLNAEQRKEAVGGLLIETEKGRITGDKAVYPLKKIDDKKLKSEEVDFVNIDGEWKMIPR